MLNKRTLIEAAEERPLLLGHAREIHSLGVDRTTIVCIFQKFDFNGRPLKECLKESHKKKFATNHVEGVIVKVSGESTVMAVN